MDSIRDIHDTHLAATYPASLAPDGETGGVALLLLDADVRELAAAFVSDGALEPGQWQTLRAAADTARVIVPQLSGDAWVYFARLYALTQAVLRRAPDARAP
jgi:hypothetical protein